MLSPIRLAALTYFFLTLAHSQGTLIDYQRAQSLQAKARGLVVDSANAINWIGESNRFWYSKSVKRGTEFVLVDAATAIKKPAFDHERLATAFNAASGAHATGIALPFAPVPAPRGTAPGTASTIGNLVFLDNESAIQFGSQGFLWKCTITAYACTKGAAIPRDQPTRRTDAPEAEAPFVEGGDPSDGLEYQPFPQQSGVGVTGAMRDQQPCATRPGRATAVPATPPAAPQVCASFDGKWEAIIQNYNVFLRAVGSSDPALALSVDGSEGNYYTLRSIAWSPNSTKLVAYHTRPGYDRQVHYIESSPADQRQPKHSTISYRKPGDSLDVSYPVLFDVISRKATDIDNTLWPNAYSLSPPVWWKAGRAFTFEYNQRGHQAYCELLCLMGSCYEVF